MRWRSCGSIGLAVSATACIGGVGTEPLPEVSDLDVFVDQAQPVLSARCANPSCHGNRERPLSLYAVHRQRMDAADVYLDDPLNDDELRHNLLQASLFALDVRDADQCMLLTMPLSVRAGGRGHAGVEVFVDEADYDYRRLHGWIERVLAKEEGVDP